MLNHSGLISPTFLSKLVVTLTAIAKSVVFAMVDSVAESGFDEDDGKVASVVEDDENRKGVTGT